MNFFDFHVHFKVVATTYVIFSSYMDSGAGGAYGKICLGGGLEYLIHCLLCITGNIEYYFGGTLLGRTARMNLVEWKDTNPPNLISSKISSYTF